MFWLAALGGAGPYLVLAHQSLLQRSAVSHGIYSKEQTEPQLSFLSSPNPSRLLSRATYKTSTPTWSLTRAYQAHIFSWASKLEQSLSLVCCPFLNIWLWFERRSANDLSYRFQCCSHHQRLLYCDKLNQSGALQPLVASSCYICFYAHILDFYWSPILVTSISIPSM